MNRPLPLNVRRKISEAWTETPQSEELARLANHILRGSVNPAFDADDWRAVDTFPHAVSLN